jgi:hypothetical protein
MHTRRFYRGKSKTRKGGRFVYPPYAKNGNINQKIEKEYIGLIPSKKELKNLDSLRNVIRNTYNVDPRILPKGTTIYRTSFEKDSMDIRAFGDVVYFGLDFLISLWYGLEIWDRFAPGGQHRHTTPYTDWYVYLHEYEVKQDIPYVFILDIYDWPGDHKNCKTQVCIHPQEVLHGNSGRMRELGTELTFPKTTAFDDILTPVKKYKIDLIRLMEYQDKLSLRPYGKVPPIENVLIPITE